MFVGLIASIAADDSGGALCFRRRSKRGSELDT